jgi:hypothetical protein
MASTLSSARRPRQDAQALNKALKLGRLYTGRPNPLQRGPQNAQALQAAIPVPVFVNPNIG